VHVAWGVLLLRIALRHSSFVATLAELARNDALCRLIGVETPESVPDSWNISRFLDVLGQEPHLSDCGGSSTRWWPNWAWQCPIWAKIPRETPPPCTPTARETRRRGIRRRGLPQPAAQERYKDDAARSPKVVEWFGYKWHLLVDAKHEVALAYRVTTANAADSKSLPNLVEQGQANLPTGRIETLAYDKAADGQRVASDAARGKIRPVIQNRRFVRSDPSRCFLATRRSNIV